MVGAGVDLDTGGGVILAGGGVGVQWRRTYSGALGGAAHASIEASIANTGIRVLHRFTIDDDLPIYEVQFVPRPINQDPQAPGHGPAQHQPQPFGLQVETVRLQERKKLNDVDTGGLAPGLGRC